MNAENPILASAAKVEAAAAFLQSRFFTLQVIEGVQAAVIRVHSPWINRKDAAAYAYCSVSEIDRASALGIFKRYERGGTPLFRRDDLDQAIETGKWSPAGK